MIVCRLAMASGASVLGASVVAVVSSEDSSSLRTATQGGDPACRQPRAWAMAWRARPARPPTTVPLMRMN